MKTYIITALLAFTFAGHSQVIVEDQFTTATGRPNDPQILGSGPAEVNLPGGVWTGKGSATYPPQVIQTISSRQAVRLTGDIGAVVPLASAGGYTKPALLRVEATFNLGTTTGTGTTRVAGVGFWNSSSEGLANSYLGFYGVTVDRNGSVKLNLNPSDFTPFVTETLPNAGGWSAGGWHTLGFSVDTTTGAVGDVVLDGVLYVFSTTVTVFTHANTNYAGVLVSAESGDGVMYYDSFRVSAADSLLNDSVVAAQKNPVPPSPGVPIGARWTSFGTPSVQGTGFLGGFKAGAVSYSGVFSGSPLTLRVKSTDAADGIAGAQFKTFKDPVFLTTATYAVMGKVTGGGVDATNDDGLWADIGSGLQLVAREGSPAPDAGGGVFKSFASLAVPTASGPIFVATLRSGTLAAPAPGNVTASNDMGVWAVDSTGQVRLILREGGSVELFGAMRTLKSFLLLNTVAGSPAVPRGYQTDGTLLYRATLSDGTQAVLRLNVP